MHGLRYVVKSLRISYTSRETILGYYAQFASMLLLDQQPSCFSDSPLLKKKKLITIERKKAKKKKTKKNNNNNNNKNKNN